MKVRSLFKYTLAALLMPALWSCAADDFDAPSSDGALTIELALPQSRAAAPGETTSDPTSQECKINNLRIIAFPQGGKGKLVNEPLTLPGGSVATTPSAQMRVNVQPGNYRIYIVANMESEVSSVTTEAQLKQVLINCGTTASPKLPQAGNLPMVYEPASVTEITTQPVTLMASMEMACVKVSLNIIFDKATNPQAAAIYGDKGLKITSVKASNVSVSQYLISNTTPYASTLEVPVNGAHYSGYTVNQSNATVNNRDVVENFSGSHTPADPNGKWCYHAVFYLPERYVTGSASQGYLTVKGSVFGASGVGTANAENTFMIELGHDISGTRQLPRDTYYEIVGTVTSLGNMNLNTFVSIKPWSEINLDASISRTLLTVNKTKATVKSLEKDYVTYTSSAPSVAFNCQTTLTSGGVAKPIIVAEHNAVDKCFTLKINPGISIADVPASQREGDAVVTLKANNITKYIDVHYDIKPFFEVDYTEPQMFWMKEGSAAELTQISRVTTNLGGVKFITSGLPGTLTSGTASITVTSQPVAGSEGQWDVVMVMTKDPVSTTVLNFQIGPMLSGYSEFNTPMKYTARPEKGNYRIYMRAINDRFGGTFPGDGSLLDALAEQDIAGSTTSNNWKDGWSNNDALDSYRHRCYFYYQYGETNGDIPEANVWRFSAGWPGDEMTADKQNPGWYYKDYSEYHMGTNSSGKAQRPIVPGETILIFSNYWDTDKGYTRHRFTHHMDPGITLFDYEDREGWYLYDPTCDPYYRIYDDKPVIVNQTYTIYTPYKVTGWWKTYGVADNNTSNPARYTVWSNSVSSTQVNSSWWKTTITLKAPQGEYEKAIQLNLDGSSAKPVMFNGNNWTEGYYNGSTWTKGKPSGV